MKITDPWVLPKGIVLTPVSELPAKLRDQMDARDGDFAISRPQSRIPSRVLDADSAALLKHFEVPKTIADAIAQYSRNAGTDPERTLDDALPMLVQLIDWQFLVPPDSEESSGLEPTLQPGNTVIGCEVLHCAQSLQDSEVYQLRRPDGAVAALKILRAGCGADSCRVLDREAAILRHLAGTVSPALLDEGIWENRRYLLLEWCEGVDAVVAAGELRQAGTAEAQRRLLDLCRGILNAYARLHAQGVIHGDVHPRNVLVNEANEVTLVDFGLARHEGLDRELGTPPRGGVGFFFEPEYAIAMRGRTPPPAASELGEQYALAALLYCILTGANYVDFNLTKPEMLRQIEEEPPVPFGDRGLGSWPEIEEILARALSKQPSHRFRSVREFAEKVATATVPERGWLPVARPATPDMLNRVLDGLLARVGFSASLVDTGLVVPPTASVTYGAAGIAYGLYRIACLRDDPSLLSLADVWCRRALAFPEKPGSYYNPEIQITPEIIGQVSPYHTLSGVYAVQALLAHAMGDLAGLAEGVEGFINASRRPCDNLDLVLGRSGTLLITALLIDALQDCTRMPPDSLIAFGNGIMESLWQELDKQPPVSEGTKITYLGIAHGWAGILYAALNWHCASGANLPHTFSDRLQQLAECAERSGQGVRWPCVLPQGRQGGPATYMSGWCNGSAGYVFLWTAAHALDKNEAYLRLAEGAVRQAWESADSVTNLCCGLAGRAYGLLNYYRHTGERLWLERAQQLAVRSALWDTTTYLAMKLASESLYKGEMGVALLAADLAQPDAACMPFFEREQYAVSASTSTSAS